MTEGFLVCDILPVLKGGASNFCCLVLPLRESVSLEAFSEVAAFAAFYASLLTAQDDTNLLRLSSRRNHSSSFMCGLPDAYPCHYDDWSITGDKPPSLGIAVLRQLIYESSGLKKFFGFHPQPEDWGLPAEGVKGALVCPEIEKLIEELAIWQPDQFR